MGAPFTRRNVNLVAGGVGKPIPGGFDWFCLDWAATDAFRQQPIGIRRVTIQLREKPSDPLTSIGLFGIGDVLRLPWTEMVLSVPSVTGNPATEPTYSLDVLAGRGSFHRDMIGRSSNESCVTPRGWVNPTFTVAARNGIGATDIVLAAANLNGVRLFPSQFVAHGDGVNDGQIQITIDGVGFWRLACDKAAGPVALCLPEIDLPNGTHVQVTGNSANDRSTIPFMVL